MAVDLKKSVYEFQVVDITGETVSLEKFRGNVCLIVNINHNCDESAEKKYRLLATLTEKYKNNNFTVLLFPCSQFGPRTNTEKELKFIKDLGLLPFGVMFKEADVNGTKAPELFKLLKTYKPGNMGGFINSNFTIFVIDRNGFPVERLTSNVHPYFLEEIIEKNL